MRIFPRITNSNVSQATATTAHRQHCQHHSLLKILGELSRSPFLKRFSSEQTPCQLQSTQPLHQSPCLKNNILFTTKYIKSQCWKCMFFFNVTFDRLIMHQYYNTKSQDRLKKPRITLLSYFQTLTDNVEVLLQVKERNPTGMQTFPCQF